MSDPYDDPDYWLRQEQAESEAYYCPTSEELETAVYFDGHYYRGEEPKEA